MPSWPDGPTGLARPSSGSARGRCSIGLLPPSVTVIAGRADDSRSSPSRCARAPDWSSAGLWRPSDVAEGAVPVGHEPGQPEAIQCDLASPRTESMREHRVAKQLLHGADETVDARIDEAGLTIDDDSWHLGGRQGDDRQADHHRLAGRHPEARPADRVEEE